MINQDEIDTIKQGVDLVPFMQACGIELKQVGGNYRGHCPFHEDTTPSLTVNPKENLWNCFGCDKGGDNIRFVQLFDRISFNEAVERLKGYFPGGKLPENGKKNNAIKKKTKPVTVRTEQGLTVQAKKLLARVVEHYQHCFAENPKGLHYLQQRNITDIKAIKDFGAGFVDGSLKNILPQDEKTTSELQALGILNKKGMTRVGRQLEELGIACYPVTLPVKDCNLFFEDHGPAEFEQLLADARPEKAVTGESRRQSMYRVEERGFRVGYGRRQYQIKGIQKGGTQLKVTVKAASDLNNSSKEFELTTIDLYSSRSRAWFAGLCAHLFNEPEGLIRQDIVKLMSLVEEYQPPAEKEDDEKVIITPEDKKLALSFLKNKDIFSQLLQDFDTLGVTGEEINKLAGYLAATSRKLADPLSVLIQSRSAAGKSTLQDAILSLIPDEDYIKYTRVTDQALFYKEEDSLVNRILAIEEAEGMGGAAYSIRNIQSAKKITVAATGKDANGRMRTEEYTVKGPVCVMITTTATQIDQETASRFVFLTIDESSSMTEAIHKMQREAETLTGLIREKKQEVITRKHHAAQRMLKNLAVVNPYAEYLSYPNHSLRARRDHKKYLGLIRSVAFLHQYQREIKTVDVEGKPVEYIEVTLEDIGTANRLANIVLGQSMDELAKPSRTLLSSIYRMVKEQAEQNTIPVDEVFFTRRMIREYTGWTDWQVKSHIKQLEELEYLVARTGTRGKEYSYVLNYNGQGEEEEKCYLNLTTVEEIQRNLKGK